MNSVTPAIGRFKSHKMGQEKGLQDSGKPSPTSVQFPVTRASLLFITNRDRQGEEVWVCLWVVFFFNLLKGE